LAAQYALQPTAKAREIGAIFQQWYAARLRRRLSFTVKP
jgi:hypothetical protein